MSVEIAVIGAQRPFVLEELERDFTVHRVWEAADKVAALAPVAARVRGVVTHAMAGLSKDLIEALPNLEICAIMGVGLETTDLAAAQGPGHRRDHHTGALRRRRRSRRSSGVMRLPADRRGRPLRALRALAAGEDRAGAQVLGQARGHPRARPHRHCARAAPCRRSVSASATMTRCRSLGVPYQAYDSPVALAQDSDILFLCAAGGPGRGHIVTAEVLDALGPEGIFVNIARGWLVDEAALVRALQRGPARRRRPGRVRARAAGAASAPRPRQRRADAAHREQHRRDHSGDGRVRARQRPLVVRGQGGGDSGGVNPRLCRARPRAARDRDSGSSCAGRGAATARGGA